MPQGLLVFIIIFIIDMIFKSIKDKQKIERAMNERRKQVEGRPASLEKTVKPIEEKAVIEESPEPLMEEDIEEYIIDINRVDEEIQTKVSYEEAALMVDEIQNSTIYEKEIVPPVKKDIVKGSKKKEDAIKRDILKGIIYSEILSEPKSLKYMRRSI